MLFEVLIFIGIEFHSFLSHCCSSMIYMYIGAVSISFHCDTVFETSTTQENELFGLWNTEGIFISEIPKCESHINSNISKYRKFWESKVLVLDTGSNMTSKYGTNIIIIIRHYKWENCETDTDRGDQGRLLYFPAQTRSNDTCNLTQSHIPWLYLHTDCTDNFKF